jgi:hypothetical protein
VCWRAVAVAALGAAVTVSCLWLVHAPGVWAASQRGEYRAYVRVRRERARLMQDFSIRAGQ